MNESDDELAAASPYTRLVGERLRNIRQQKNLSLNEVEQQSEDEFKASVLGAYERGERSISVPRLERLARFYEVTVDQLLPRDTQRVEGNRSNDQVSQKLRIDVSKLLLLKDEKFKLLASFLRLIQVQRQDFNGKVITVREHDVRAIAVMLDVNVEDVGVILGELDLLFIPPTS